jgi:N-acetylneuraminate synthase
MSLKHKSIHSTGRSHSKRHISKKETEYLDALVRGAYAKKDLEPGYVFTKESFERDFYLAIPLRKGQLSCREIFNGECLTEGIKADEPLSINHLSGPYSKNEKLKSFILNRGL